MGYMRPPIISQRNHSHSMGCGPTPQYDLVMCTSNLCFKTTLKSWNCTFKASEPYSMIERLSKRYIYVEWAAMENTVDFFIFGWCYNVQLVSIIHNSNTGQQSLGPSNKHTKLRRYYCRVSFRSKKPYWAFINPFETCTLPQDHFATPF